MSAKKKENDGFLDCLLIGLLEPVLFLMGVWISCSIILLGMSSDSLNPFTVVNFANENKSISDIIAIFLPISIGAIAVSVASFIKPRFTTVVDGVRIAYVFVQTLMLVFLAYTLVRNSVTFERHFEQPTILEGPSLRIVENGIITALILCSGIYIIAKLDEAFHPFATNMTNRNMQKANAENDG